MALHIVNLHQYVKLVSVLFNVLSGFVSWDNLYNSSFTFIICCASVVDTCFISYFTNERNIQILGLFLCRFMIYGRIYNMSIVIPKHFYFCCISTQFNKLWIWLCTSYLLLKPVLKANKNVSFFVVLLCFVFLFYFFVQKLLVILLHNILQWIGCSCF